MSKDIEPIQEHLTLCEKIKRYFKQKTYKCKVEKMTIDLTKNQMKVVNNMGKFGVSAQEASESLAKAGKSLGEALVFNKFLTPNEMRKIVDNDITTLYADGNPYCIINQKGDVIWQSKK